MKKTIALLGQPNSGKSTVFNGLTGAHQHVGNWPGKTVECKEGTFTHQGVEYNIIDLPGSYSLSAGSDEERITADYIRGGKADLVAVLVDSSQLERSLYMYVDFVGTKTPVVLLLNLMDVAEKKGIHIDTERLSKRTGIPVIGFVASDTKRYGALKKILAEAVTAAKVAEQSELMRYYTQDTAITFEELAQKAQETTLFTAEKEAVRELEKTDKGLMVSGKHKYEYIDSLLADAVKKKADKAELTGFDKKALGKHSGKWIAIGIIAVALVGAMLLAAPIMAFGFSLATILSGP